MLNIKKCVTEATHEKRNPDCRQTKLKQKRKTYYHPSGVAFLPNSYRMITKKGYNIPLII